MTDPDPDPRRPSPATRAALGLALAVVPLLLLVLLAEGLLWALDLGAADSLPPQGRGFDAQAAYLRPTDGGGWVTQLFGDPEREVVIPPRDGRTRVLLFGGSNTQLLPESVLAEVLAEGSPGGPGWEVINLGRQGYGSARVVILLEQALRHLDPDVVVVYSGHNEFVEAGFRVEVEARTSVAPDPWSEALTSLRLYRVMEQAARPAASPPTDLDPAEREYSEYTWDDTLAVYAAYRANLQRMADACRARDVPLVLGTVVGNDWAVPWVSDVGADADDEARRKTIRSVTAISQGIPERYRLWDAGQPPTRARVGHWFNGDGSGPELPAVPEHRGVLQPMPARARGDEEQDSVEGACWPDPSRWRASTRQLVTRTLRHYAESDLTPAEHELLVQAHEAVTILLKLLPTHSRALFLKGQITWLLGRRKEGATFLRAAAARDCAPRRGNPTTNESVRAVAASSPGVTLFDAEADFREWSPWGLTSYVTLMDGCHLQPGARVVLLEQLAPRVREALGR